MIFRTEIWFVPQFEHNKHTNITYPTIWDGQLGIMLTAGALSYQGQTKPSVIDDLWHTAIVLNKLFWNIIQMDNNDAEIMHFHDLVVIFFNSVLPKISLSRWVLRKMISQKF